MSVFSMDNEDKNIVRKSFRVPVPHGMVTLTYNEQEHPVRDLSMYGVGLSVTKPDTFAVGSVLEGVSITFPDKTFLVDIRVVHISAFTGDTLLCGMEIINTHDSGYIDWMTRVIAEIKQTMLSNLSKSS